MGEPPTLIHVVSRDETPIAARRSGSGPPVVLVHGGSGSDFSWRLVAPLLARRFTVYAMQRRGRGESGDAEEYSLELEGADVAAVVDRASTEGGRPAGLVGHSYGADCALEASLQTDRLHRLFLYEPSLRHAYSDGFLGRMETLRRLGRLEELLLALLHEAGLSRQEMEALQASPTWTERVAIAPTLPREARAEMEFDVTPERFGAMRVPTLLLVGSETAPAYRRSVETVHRVLPNSRLVTLLGHGHAGLVTAPELVAREIAHCLEVG